MTIKTTKKTDRQKQIARLDKLASEIVRRRAVIRLGGCERCYAEHPWQELQCCHFISRTIFMSRWDVDDNLAGLCSGCHWYLDRNPFEKIDWWVGRVGQDKVDLLQWHPYHGKADLESVEIYLRQELKKLREVS